MTLQIMRNGRALMVALACVLFLDSIAVSVFVDFLTLAKTIRNKSKTNLMVRRAGLSKLHWFQYWPLDHLQMFSNWSSGVVTIIATLSWIVLLVLLVGIELVSSSTIVTSVKSATRVLSS